MNLAALLDGWAHAATAQPDAVVDQRPGDARIAIMTALSRMAFGDHHSRAAARALRTLLDADTASRPDALTGRQHHVLIAIAAAELLERDQLAAFLQSYRDPGVEVWYHPVSVTALRHAFHEVLATYPTAKRLRLLTSLAAQPSEDLVRWAPPTTEFAPAFLAQLAGHPDSRIRAALAENVHATREQLTASGVDRDELVREAVANHNATDPRTLDALATDPEELVRLAVAANVATPLPTLARLASDPTWTIRVAVACNTNAGAAVRSQLAQDPQWQVRAMVAENPATEPGLLAHLAIDELAYIREAVARNPNASRAILRRLAFDRSWSARNDAIRHPSTNPALVAQRAASLDPADRAAAAANPNLATELILRLSRDHDALVRRAIALNPSAPAAIMACLATDSDATVRKVVAERSDTTPAILERLAHDRDRGVRLVVAEHPQAPPKAIAVLETDVDLSIQAAAIGAPAITDPYDRYRVALSKCDFHRRILTSPTVTRLIEALRAIAAGAHPPARDVRDAATLPGFDDLPFPTAQAAQACLHDAPVPVRVLPNGREQRQNGIEMNNCTLSDSYVTACREGTTIIAAFEHAGERYNVAWHHNGARWGTRDLKGVNNVEPSAEIRTLTAELATVLEGLQPEAGLDLGSATALRAGGVNLLDSTVRVPTRSEPFLRR